MLIDCKVSYFHSLKLFLLLILLFTFVNTINSQTIQFDDIKQEYTEGEGFFVEEDFKEALYIFLKIANKGYINANLQYKIGLCYLNQPGLESKAIPYLEEAVKRTNIKYKRGSLEEKSAPLETFFYLGNAYKVDNQLDKALKVYNKFINNPKIENYNFEMVENEVTACEIAKAIQDKPIDVEFINAGTMFNTPNQETNAVLSANDSVVVFVRSLKLYTGIFCSRRISTGWSEPENLNTQIQSDGEFFPTAISADGNEILLIKKLNKNGDIYTSAYINGAWTIAQPIAIENVNTSKDENAACFSSDENTLYFSSNRRESKGGYDIFKVERDKNNKWGKIENLGKTINTEFDEIEPSLSTDDQTIYFTSKAHYNMGGFDIFYSKMENKKWSIPQNIGYPLNNTGNNIGFKTTGTKTTGIITLMKDDGKGQSDIYFLEFKKMPGQ